MRNGKNELDDGRRGHRAVSKWKRRPRSIKKTYEERGLVWNVGREGEVEGKILV